MARFRKRPVVVEAVQWWPGTDVPGVVMRTPMLGGRGHGPIVGQPQPAVETLEGVMWVSPGDWIITGVRGEQYPCKPDIFAQTYEPVVEDDQS